MESVRLAIWPCKEVMLFFAARIWPFQYSAEAAPVLSSGSSVAPEAWVLGKVRAGPMCSGISSLVMTRFPFGGGASLAGGSLGGISLMLASFTWEFLTGVSLLAASLADAADASFLPASEAFCCFC